MGLRTVGVSPYICRLQEVCEVNYTEALQKIHRLFVRFANFGSILGIASYSPHFSHTVGTLF
jgi:hypothetical protein